MKYPFLEQHGQRSADFLGLTIAGAIKIAPYPEECHFEAFNNYVSAERVKKVTIKDPIKFYIYLCNEHCKSHFIDPDFRLLTHLAGQHNVDAESEVYLPKEQRVKVEIPKEETGYKKHKQEGPIGPRKPLPSTLLLSKNLFPFSPQDRSKIDDIAEAIKFVGYMAAGINGSIYSAQDAMQSFMAKANLKINEMIERNEKYTLDLLTLINTVDDFIEWTIMKHNALPHIKKISSPEDAKLKAHQAIAEFAPKLLKPFREVAHST